MMKVVIFLYSCAIILLSLIHQEVEGQYSDVRREPRAVFPKASRAASENNVKRYYPKAVPGEQCKRTCDGRPKICYFDFYIEQYSVLGPACGNCSNGVLKDCSRPQCVTWDGSQRPILTINRQIPGPAIEVCRNDRVLIQVNNMLPEQATSLHCHGLRQIQSPWMDGVPGVTQCAILPANTFVYNFLVPKPGTYWCHSHLGSQKLDVVALPLIVRLENDPLAELYDEDIHPPMMGLDVTEEPATYYVPGIHNETYIQLPKNVAINGQAKISENGSNPQVPWVVYEVEYGKRYRMRLIGATCMTCAYAFKIMNHKLLVITTDGGNAIEPTTVDTIAFNPADRMDFVLTANRTPGVYLIIVQGLDECSYIQQIALLKYKESNTDISKLNVTRRPFDRGVILNYPNATCDGTSKTEICFNMVNGKEDAPSLKTYPGWTYYQSNVSLGFRLFTADELFQPGKYEHYEEPEFNRLVVYTLNNCEYASPPSTLLTQFYDNPPSTFCNSCSAVSDQPGGQCTQLLYLPLRAIVDIIIVDKGGRGDFNHPMHIHGYDFWILEMGLFKGNLTTAEKYSLLSRKARMDGFNTKRRVQKDSISVPASGYAVLRILTDNPGYWIFHCHFEYHLESGMALIYQVGNREDMLMPSDNFPVCGNYYGV